MQYQYLSVDIESFSSVDIRSSGAYAYSESPDFQILLLGYRFDDMEEAKVIDLSKFFNKEEAVDYLASHHPDVYDALTDDQVIKTAFNANFERTCLGRYFGYMDPAQWRCTMVRCGAAGLPMSLEGAGAALHLPEDKAKMKIGKALITYFCKPCKPTKTNGGRRRNLPEHDKEKWRLFKEYCARDVDTEHTILEIVGLDVLPESEQHLWELDQKMNDYGVRLDVPYIEGILEYSENRNEELKAEAKELTGLENPNSVAQLREWLSDHGVETTSLTKADVERILSGECDADVRRVLEIRQALGKTSTKKYAAMMEAVCGDDRLRGILQYYGANRSGRWAGRIVQVHNLPQNHIDDLDWVRRKIAEQDFEAVEMVYGELAFLFSQLIRTAFIPSEGNTFIVSDFSAIEARVLAWLAGEKWRMDVFKNGGDIYCTSASRMFGVPVEKHGVNSHLRQKGKIAELALGYQGGVGAMKQMDSSGAIPEEELPGIVARWREASPNIVRLWYSMERAAKMAILDSRPKSRPVYLKKFDPKRARENERIMGADPGEYSDWFIDHEACVAFYMDGDALKMKLPSGRCLSYWNARVVRKEDGRDHIVYEGVNQTTKQWTEIETYGGKLVENCLAGDTKVLTNNGIKCITDVLDTDLLWDGIEWVTHEGLIPKGKQTTINIDGIRMTAEHRILTKGGWRSASQIKRHHRYKMRIPDSGFLRWIRWPKVPVEYPLRVRKKHSHARVRISKNEAEILRMQAGPTHRRKAYKTRIVRSPHLERMAFNDAEMYKPESPGMEKLWRTRHCSMPRMAHVRKLLQRHGSRVQARLVAGQDRRGRSLLQRELQMGYPERAGQKQKEHSLYRHTHRKNASYRSFRKIRYQKHNAAIPDRARMAGGYAVHKAGLSEQVFDIQNAGPRHRFAVMSDSRIIIVHNCVQGIARDCLAETLKRVSAAGYHIVMHVHDEIIVDTPRDTAEESFEEITELMGISPVWAPGLILKGDGYMTDYYRKD